MRMINAYLKIASRHTLAIGAFFINKNENLILKTSEYILKNKFGDKMQKEFILCQKRITTMRSRLKQACDLIDNDQFLGMFRNRQINYKKEFDQSVKMIKNMQKSGKIRNPKRYFAKIWSRDNIDKTLKIVREFINRQIARLAEQREQQKRNHQTKIEQQSRNQEGLSRLALLKREYSLS